MIGALAFIHADLRVAHGMADMLGLPTYGERSEKRLFENSSPSSPATTSEALMTVKRVTNTHKDIMGWGGISRTSRTELECNRGIKRSDAKLRAVLRQDERIRQVGMSG
jgi:hypothetical protein